MKKAVFFILLFGVCMMQAQESLSVRKALKENKLIQLDMDWGVSVDMAHLSGSNALTAFADRGAIFPTINFRAQYIFSKSWGCYANIRLGMPEKYKKDSYSELSRVLESEYYVTDLINERQKPRTTPCLEAGILYRIENPQWAFYPHLGIGVNNVPHQHTYVGLKRKGSNDLYEIRCGGVNPKGENETMDMFILSMGFSLNYKLSRRCYLLLNVSYTQPIGKASRLLLEKTDLYTDEVIDRKLYKSHTLGRELNLGIGLGFPIFLGRK